MDVLIYVTGLNRHGELMVRDFWRMEVMAKEEERFKGWNCCGEIGSGVWMTSSRGQLYVVT